MNIGKFIKDQRTIRRLSLQRLVNLLAHHGYDVTRAGVSSWEIGRTMPPIYDEAFRHALAGALGMDEDEMISLMGFTKEMTLEARLAVEVINKLPEPARKRLLALILTFKPEPEPELPPANKDL
jgi:transcriptional regulator with XRE-family HTH domain